MFNDDIFDKWLDVEAINRQTWKMIVTIWLIVILGNLIDIFGK